MMFERLYILESNNKKLIDYGNYIDSTISESDYRYYLGMKYRDELINMYNNNNKDFSYLNRSAKKLALRSK